MLESVVPIGIFFDLRVGAGCGAMFASFSFNLLVFCHKEGKYGFYEARDMIEERIGRKLGCECELLKS